ncbi:MAG: hypothetical protein ACKOE3_14610, partial [Betaproteobacteria bacterium]
MSKPSRKRKKNAQAAPLEVAEVGAAVAEALPAPDAAEPAPANGLKACSACSVTLPMRAKFCSACGEPQLPGLQRPEYRAPLAQLQPQGQPQPQAVNESPSRPPAQTAVPTVPKVAPVRSSGATLVPSLAADRPIPASLLAPGLTPEQLQAALGKPPLFSPTTQPTDVQGAVPEPAALAAPAPVPPEPAAPQPHAPAQALSAHAPPT